MNLPHALANRLKEVFTEGKWVMGTNFKEQIFELDWQDAIKSVHQLNSVADLTFHILYYINGVNQLLKGGTLDIKDEFSFDAPPIASEQDWLDLKENFSVAANEFINLVEQMDNEKLFKPFVDEKYGNYHRNLDVMIEHTYYHLGQIVLIKKLLKKQDLL